ncbi:putative polyvinyl alcohol dehydrogenase (cytochrome) [Helianthus annuus]|nr:putative polyvinyl alcohol dehydrogenase (cytochrome) [Helianthus annuus]
MIIIINIHLFTIHENLTTMSSYGNLISVIVPIWLLLLVQYASTDWLNHGGDLGNRRFAASEYLINPSTVRNLRLRWKFFTGRDISATPAVAGGVVYFPSWNGYLYAVNAFTGGLIWQQNIVNRISGQLVWLTTIDPRPLALITASGTVYSRGFYVGVSSLEESLPADKCCTFRGSLVKLDTRTGAILWQTYTVPDNGGKLGGYSGAAIWGSSPAIDLSRGFVYVATGNLYTAPPEVTECQERQNNQTTKPTKPDQCTGPDVRFNSIIAFDMNSGNVVWSQQLGGYDVFYFACLVPNNPDCPPGPNVDADFGEAPMLLTITSNRRLRDIVVAVQKSGFAWALDRDNGEIVWFKLAGPGSNEGGGIWGAATDGKRVYTNIANGAHLPFTLAPSNRTTTAGGWVALDANTGQILWTTADPSNDSAEGPVSVTRGVVFAGSVAPNGPLYAMDARTGSVLWSYNTGATIYGGVSASYGCIYVGHGYTVGLGKFHPWTPGNYLFAFCVI